MDHWQEIGKARRVLWRIRPAVTMIEISRIIIPEILVEIEADDVIM